MKSVKCKSGLTGWRGNLHEVYTDFNDWKLWAESHGLHKKLGYKTPEATWDDNPMVEGSVQPSDYRKVK
jgi:hypothetical protein